MEPASNPEVPEDIESDEQTPLFVILPSANSTKNPSLSNLEDYAALGDRLLKRSDEDERSHASLEVESSYKKRPQFSYAWKNLTRKYGKLTLIMLACLFLVVLSVVVYVVSESGAKTPSSPHPTYSAGNSNHRVAFSTKDPVTKLDVLPITRPPVSDPSKIISPDLRNGSLPTNEWYQNLLMLGEGQEPTFAQNAFAIPFMVDVVGVIPGVHLSPQAVGGTTRVTNLISNPLQGIILGAAEDASVTTVNNLTKTYTVEDLSPLAITLKWNALPMSSSIVRGMPYATVHYPKGTFHANSNPVLPTIAAEVPLRGDMLVDRTHKFTCGTGSLKSVLVQKEIKMTFSQSDFTWLAFFSEPVWVQCITSPSFGKAKTLLQVRSPSSLSTKTLTVRVALVTTCATGTNPIYCTGPINQAKIINKEILLREHADVYPGPKANFHYDVNNEENKAVLKLNWDPRNMTTMEPVSVASGDTSAETLIYAMPHHMDSFGTSPEVYPHCTRIVFGECCIVAGSEWHLNHTLPPVSFWASVPPSPDSLGYIAQALHGDMNYTLPPYYLEGGGDTYFSGKMLARLARILLIAEEVIGVCKNPTPEYASACRSAVFPSAHQMADGKTRLRQAVEVWINGTAMTPFVYDAEWGGIVSCGCFFDGKTQSCSNRYPNCPALTNPGLNFGNGYYNDHHFHYGYFIYSSAAVAHFDPAWGRKYFENVKLLVRDIANPSTTDKFFTVTRHKDWYRGHSWAGGITPPVFASGRNQESTSEALNAYEGVSLYGQVMTEIFQQDGDKRNMAISEQIRDVGKLLLATELQSVDEYWHVRSNSTIYPASYTQNVVGILWSVMTEFQTWFGAAPYLPYGIQLLPITAISQQRDTPDWAREMYSPFADSCNADPGCQSNGWSILELAILAEVGHPKNATSRALELPLSVFNTAGGNGHSLTNTLWYISTRPKVNPLVILPPPKNTGGPPGVPAGMPPVAQKQVKNCGLPHNCTSAILDTVAGGFTCRARIDWLMNYKGDSERQACATVGGVEFPVECGACASPVPANSTYAPVNCGLPNTCTPTVMATTASGYTCASRIKWLMTVKGKTEAQACYEVGTIQFPTECGPCGPKKAPPSPPTTSNAVSPLPGVIHCGKPKNCTGEVLNTLAGGYTCLARITWLMTVEKETETKACAVVAGTEFPSECGACNPHA